MKKEKLEPLTASEFEVMKVVWDSDHDLTLQEILAETDVRYEKNWKRQTVATFLSHLIKKGVCESYRIGRYFYYKPVVDENVYKNAETQHMLDFWYNGSMENLLSALCKHKDFQDGNLSEIKKAISKIED